jgi:hypothetical protein
MKYFRILIAITVQAACASLFLWWYLAPSYVGGKPTVIAWPAIALARSGVSHSWIFWLGILIAFTCALMWISRKSWMRLLIVNMLGIGIYCAIGWWYIMRMSVPLPPATPYDTNSCQRAIYLQKYDEGFRSGMSGRFRTYCFAPECESNGYYDGQIAGLEIWYRVLGRQSPFKRRKGAPEL